jgi:hypothetical protein
MTMETPNAHDHGVAQETNLQNPELTMAHKWTTRRHLNGLDHKCPPADQPGNDAKQC